MPRRALRKVAGVEAVGPYTLVRIDRSGLVPGEPGQFFMLEAPGRLLPRPFSLCLAPAGELGFLVDPVGPGTEAIAGVGPGDRLHVLGPLGHGFRLDVPRPLLVGGGIGVAPNAEVVVDPVLVTDVMPDGHDVLACGPEPMLEAVRVLAPGAQLAWEAPMACGYGACYGCAVELAGEWKRLCVEGPVIREAA